MKDKVKLLAIDLDDTLLHDDCTLSKRNINAIRAAAVQGVRIVIATGRMYQTAVPIGRALGLGDLPMILYSGGLIQTAEQGRILYEKPISVSGIRSLLELRAMHDWYVQMYIDDELRIHHETESSLAYSALTGAVPHYYGDALYDMHERVLKVLLVNEKKALDEATAILQSHLGHEICAVRSKENYLEVIHKDCSKGNALMSMARDMGVSEGEIMAIGNSQNDISMLERVGYAVAVENAEAEVKSVANIMTSRNNDDGVAAVIEKYVLA